MATLTSALSQGKKPRFAVMGRKVYMTDGWRPLQVWDGARATMVDAGITGPSTAASAWAPTPTTAAGSITAGSHKFRYRYLDSKTGYVSEPSNEYQATVTAGAQQLTFSIDTSGAGNMIRSSDTKVDKIVVEMTGAGGIVFYKAVEVLQTASSVAVSIADTALVNQTLVWPGRRAEDFGVHLVPPIASHVLAFRGRLFMFGQTVHSLGTVAVTNGSATITGTSTDWTAAAARPTSSAYQNRTTRLFQKAGDTQAYEIDTRASATSIALSATYAGSTTSGSSYKIYSRDVDVYYSEPGYPEAFPVFNTFKGPETGPLRAMAGHLAALVMFTINGMERVVYTQDPSRDGRRTTISSERGAVSQECVLNVEERLYALDRRGFHVYEGESPKAISRSIETFVARINFAVEDTFHACFYPKLRAVRWWVALDSDTNPKHYFQWDVDRSSWSIGEREVAVTASTLVPTDDGVAVLVGDENGNTWFDDSGTTDGSDTVPQTLVGAGATTTTVPSQTTLPASPTLVGVPVYHAVLGETRVIASHNTAQFVVSSAFTRAPTFDERIHLGRAKAKLRTKAFRVPGKDAKHAGRYVHVHFVPLASARYGRLRFYRNQSSTAVTYASTYSSVAGATNPANGETDWILDFSHADGVIRVPIGLETAHTTTIELELRDSDVPVKILGLTIDGVDLEAVT